MRRSTASSFTCRAHIMHTAQKSISFSGSGYSSTPRAWCRVVWPVGVSPHTPGFLVVIFPGFPRVCVLFIYTCDTAAKLAWATYGREISVEPMVSKPEYSSEVTARQGTPARASVLSPSPAYQPFQSLSAAGGWVVFFCEFRYLGRALNNSAVECLCAAEPATFMPLVRMDGAHTRGNPAK